MRTFIIQVRSQFGGWYHYTTKHHEADTYRVAKARATLTKKQHRIIDGDGRLIDIVDP
jgi:hypothetical protein